jgi:uncharacterized protein with PQ loop repeat
MTDALAFGAAVWGVLMAVAPLLQIRRMAQTSSSSDISLGYLTVLQIGFVLWVAYGVAIANMALIIPNTVALIVGIATIAVAIRFRPGEG